MIKLCCSLGSFTRTWRRNDPPLTTPSNDPPLFGSPGYATVLSCLRHGFFGDLTSSSLPEEVLSAEEFSFPGKALFRQVALAVAALDARRVPGAIQYVQQEPVQDRTLASGADDHHDDVTRRPLPPLVLPFSSFAYPQTLSIIRFLRARDLDFHWNPSVSTTGYRL